MESVSICISCCFGPFVPTGCFHSEMLPPARRCTQTRNGGHAVKPPVPTNRGVRNSPEDAVWTAKAAKGHSSTHWIHLDTVIHLEDALGILGDSQRLVVSFYHEAREPSTGFVYGSAWCCFILHLLSISLQRAQNDVCLLRIFRVICVMATVAITARWRN